MRGSGDCAACAVRNDTASARARTGWIRGDCSAPTAGQPAASNAASANASVRRGRSLLMPREVLRRACDGARTGGCAVDPVQADRWIEAWAVPARRDQSALSHRQVKGSVSGKDQFILKNRLIEITYRRVSSG